VIRCELKPKPRHSILYSSILNYYNPSSILNHEFLLSYHKPQTKCSQIQPQVTSQQSGSTPLVSGGISSRPFLARTCQLSFRLADDCPTGQSIDPSWLPFMRQCFLTVTTSMRPPRFLITNSLWPRNKPARQIALEIAQRMIKATLW
jgi:hypothetical protein